MVRPLKTILRGVHGHRLAFACILVVAAHFTSVAGPLSHGKAGAATRALYGLHMDLTYEADAKRRQRIIDTDKALGAEVSRNSFLMSQIQPQRGVYNWSRVDSIVGALRSANIRPLLLVYGSPAWANGSRDNLVVPTDPVAFEKWVADYAAFMRVAAARYPGQMWEIGNEPNEKYFWKPGPNVAQYDRWYRAVRQAIKGTDPTAKVSLGGLTGLSQSCCIRGVEFLKQLIRRGAPMDYVAIHPYTDYSPQDHVNGQNNFDDIALIRNTLESMGRKNVPLWVTEWGWGYNGVPEATRARWVRSSLGLIRDKYTYVTVATFFMDRAVPGTDYGLYDARFVPRLSAAEYQLFMASVPLLQ